MDVETSSIAHLFAIKKFHQETHQKLKIIREVLETVGV